MTRAPTKASMETGPKCLSRRADADWRLVRFGCANEDLIRRGSDVTCWVANGRFDDPRRLWSLTRSTSGDQDHKG